MESGPSRKDEKPRKRITVMKNPSHQFTCREKGCILLHARTQDFYLFLYVLAVIVHIREIAFDRWGAIQMVQNLERMGFTVVPFGQGFKDMSPPTKELMKLVLEKRIAHGGHPVLRWMMDNIYIRTDPAGNIKADKEKSTEKIDGDRCHHGTGPRHPVRERYEGERL